MSGGSLDYIQHKIDDAADTIFRRAADRDDANILRAFSRHLAECGRICHEIEWDFSGDSSLDGEDYQAIRRLIGRKAIVGQAVTEAKEMIKRLQQAIEEGERP